MSASDNDKIQELSSPATAPGAPPSGVVDVGSLLASSEVTIRPQEDPADADLRRFKDRARFLLSWGVVLGVGGVALHLTLSDHVSAHRAAWGKTIVAGLLSALGGYALGKSEKR